MMRAKITATLLVAFTFVCRATAVLIYAPPLSYKIPRVLYARTLLLHTGEILATWENYSPEPPYFPIYKSQDNGQTWFEFGRVTDQVNGWGLRYQPFLYELPQPFAGYPAGTLLLGGSSIPQDLSVTQLELYVSTDGGRGWKFLSHVARGGQALPNNGLTPVWEPFLMLYNGKLIYYYSDQRDPKHGQKLDHQLTSDLLHWEPPVDDVTWQAYKYRPGMTTVALLPNGQYITTHEVCGDPGGCPVYFRLATDPTKFNYTTEYPLKDQNGKQPAGSPYVVWTPVGGPNGTIVVSAGSNSEVYLNKRLGAGSWQKVPTSAPTAYTRSLLVLPDKRTILIVGAGVLNGSNNTVTAQKFFVS